MRKKNIIKEIKYNEQEKVIYIKRFNNREEIIDLFKFDDQKLYELYKQLKLSNRYCGGKFILPFGVFILLNIVVDFIPVINFYNPFIYFGLVGIMILDTIRLLNIRSKLVNSNTYELISNFLENEKVVEDYEEVKGMGFMKNKKNQLDKTKAIDVEYQELGNVSKNEFVFAGKGQVEDLDDVLNGYLEEIQKVISSMSEPFSSVSSSMRLSAISAKYYEIIKNTGNLSREDKLNYLSEVQELYAEIDPNYKKYVRNKH